MVAAGWLVAAPLEPGKSLPETVDAETPAGVFKGASKDNDSGDVAAASANRDSWLGAGAGAALSRDVMDAQCKGFCAFFDAVQTQHARRQDHGRLV